MVGQAHTRVTWHTWRRTGECRPRPAARALTSLADTFIKRGRGLLGKPLGLTPAGR